MMSPFPGSVTVHPMPGLGRPAIVAFGGLLGDPRATHRILYVNGGAELIVEAVAGALTNPTKEQAR
jgi:hypothetical protein